MKIFIGEKDVHDYLVLKTIIENWGRKRKQNVLVYWMEKLYYQIPDCIEKCDVVFLEIDLDINGYEFAKMLRKNHIDVPLVFQTYNCHFAIDSYDVQAKHYFLKPVKENKIEEILDSILLKSQRKELIYTFKNRVRKIAFDDILSIETSKCCLDIQTVFGKEKCYLSLKEIQKQLDKRFFRCHRSFIVNMDYVQSLDVDSCILKNKQVVPIAKVSKTAFKNEFYDTNLRPICLASKVK